MNTKTIVIVFTALFVSFIFCLPVSGQVNANFTAVTTSGCTPFNVQFNDQSTGNPNQWYWDFGNGTSSIVKNPVATYTTSGTYTVRLIVQNGGSEDYLEKKAYINVSQTPDAQFSMNIDSGCAPLDVNFSNNSNLFGEPLGKWIWDFGDGNTSPSQSPQHRFMTPGVFTVKLTAENAAGCNSSISQVVRTGAKPTANFKASPLDGCNSQPRNFNNQSLGSFTSSVWDFGDGTFSYTKNAQHRYTDTGWFSVKLTVSDNGCMDSVTFNKYLHIKSPVAVQRHSVADCSDPYTINFKGYLSKGVQTWNWDFGDGGTASNSNPIHTYATNGTYIVTLTVQANGCTDVAVDTAFINNMKPSFQVSPFRASYCKYDSITFTANNYDPLYVFTFAWDFGDGVVTGFRPEITNAVLTHVYTQSGFYKPILYIKNKELCIDTITKNNLTLEIDGPLPAFNFVSPVCVNSLVTFKDQSQPFNNIALTKWVWDYGDGNTATQSAPPFSNTFSFPGVYHTTLKLFDAKGCYDTVSHYITIFDAPAVDAGRDTFLCAGNSVTLNPTGAANYNWANSPFLSCTNCSNPVATPVNSTVLYVTGTNAAGCAATDSIKLTVQPQQTLTLQPLNDTVCIGGSVQLTATGMDSYQWQPPSGLSNAQIANPLATPASTTSYTVTGKDNKGCFTNTATANIVVNPLPSINIVDSIVTIQPGTNYQLTTTFGPGITQWQWQPTQWLSNATIANPIAQPPTDVTYTLTAGDNYGCVARDQITIHVICNNSSIYMPNTFSPNNDGVNDQFYPRSNRPLNFKAFRIFNRWGQVVFEAKDFAANDANVGWDGRYKGQPAQADVYVYVLEMICSNGVVFRQNGNITLIR